MIKRIRQREFVIDLVGPVIVGEYHFTIKFDLDGLLSDPLICSISDKIYPMKTMRIAQDIASFTAGELRKIATSEFKGKAEYYQQIIQLSEIINNKIKNIK